MISPIRVLLVDDHEMVRQSLSALLESRGLCEVVGDVGDGEAAIRSAVELNPDVVVLDVDMPGMLSFDAAERIGQLVPKARIVFLSAFCHDHYIERALGVQARGYLTKTQPTEVITEAIRLVANGRTYFSEDVRSRLLFDSGGLRLKPTRPTLLSSLSARELDVLTHIAGGLSKKEIAATLSISVKTVNGHAERLMAKLKINDRVRLTRFAIREGLVQP